MPHSVSPCYVFEPRRALAGGSHRRWLPIARLATGDTGLRYLGVRTDCTYEFRKALCCPPASAYAGTVRAAAATVAYLAIGSSRGIFIVLEITVWAIERRHPCDTPHYRR